MTAGSCLHPGRKGGGQVGGDWPHRQRDAIQTARDKEHRADLENGMVAHYLENHRGEEPQFRMYVVQKFESTLPFKFCQT